MCDNNSETKVEVKVEVSKIVKYCCVAGVLIVGIIFGASVITKLLENWKKD